MGQLKPHSVLGTSLLPPWPPGYKRAVFAAGCFWGLEKGLWRLPGVHSTAAGYSCGFTPNPTYSEVSTGLTGHTEAVLVVFDPARLSFADLLRWFWECHDPTQGMGQGKDRGTQYRSAILTAVPLTTGEQPLLLGSAIDDLTAAICDVGARCFGRSSVAALA